ncbi:DUF2279 domain-containing protein [Aurantibacter sp.]|uniref:DUF2279 domain-containing protein n=1 Tax=Aurantibacter sp. TaxID=2807103 RepID=UPI0035C8234A
MFCTVEGFSQYDINSFLKPSDTLHPKRLKTLVITEASVIGLSLIGLNQLWYNDFERSKFHTLNDSKEWLQMDKVGHAFSAYQLGRFGAESLKWSGVDPKNQLIYGATLGFGYLSVIELFDGFSKEWGFSWSDMAANATGTGLYISQQLLWKEQRIAFKFSFNRTGFAKQRPNKLGNGFTEEILKDYNGQTYWLSANVYSFFKTEKIPKWLNVAFGYGATGMLSGETKNVDFPNQERLRQFYLSLDVDLTRIKTNSNVLKTLFSVFNSIKIPFPALEINSKGLVNTHVMYF